MPLYEMEIFQGQRFQLSVLGELFEIFHRLPHLVSDPVPVSSRMMSWETRIISQPFGKTLPFQGWQSCSKPLSWHTFGWTISELNTRSPDMIVNHPKITKDHQGLRLVNDVCKCGYSNPQFIPNWSLFVLKPMCFRETPTWLRVNHR